MFKLNIFLFKIWISSLVIYICPDFLAMFLILPLYTHYNFQLNNIFIKLIIQIISENNILVVLGIKLYLPDAGMVILNNLQFVNVIIICWQ